MDFNNSTLKPQMDEAPKTPKTPKPGDIYVDEIKHDGKPLRFCFLCDIPFNSATMEASHCQGKKHKKKMAETRGQSIASIRANSKFYGRDRTALPTNVGHCHLCDVGFPTEHQRESHMK